MDFGFSEEQEMLRKSARDFLAKESPMTYVRRMMEDDLGYSVETWRKMAELGWMGLIYPESHGGAGLSMVDLVVVLEEMGRVVMPGPFFSTVLLGGLAVLEGGDESQKERYLKGIAAGELKATLAVLEPNGRSDAAGLEATAVADSGGYLLSGSKLFVPDAHVADLVVVAVRTERIRGEEGISLFAVEVPRGGVTVTPLKTMDQTRKLFEVKLDQVRVGPEALIGARGGGWSILKRVTDRAKVALCAEMCGGAERVLEMSVEYAKVRVQFDRPIGSFQAIQHKCANMLLLVESAKSATYYAAWAVANHPAEAPLAAAMAKSCTSDAYRTVVGEGIQIHGGIGFTWEHDMHVYFKRAKGSEVTFGDATYNRELVAQLIEL
ncbi:MAG TPA: acyl-CoA dehydrogenase family protein [Candidatus Binatia bacterium]|nr:acyl-CoA dehydrogenase family protein [Candidatus Binatia bacterium]